MFRDEDNFTEDIMNDMILNLLFEQEHSGSPANFNELLRSRANFIFDSPFDYSFNSIGESSRENILFNFNLVNDQNREEQTVLSPVETNPSNVQKGKRQEFHNKKISETAECSICLLDMKKNSLIPNLECKHEYHRKCLMKWIQKQETCPLCRVDLSDDFK